MSKRQGQSLDDFRNRCKKYAPRLTNVSVSNFHVKANSYRCTVNGEADAIMTYELWVDGMELGHIDDTICLILMRARNSGKEKKSRILSDIMESVRGLHSIGTVSDEKLKEFERLCEDD